MIEFSLKAVPEQIKQDLYDILLEVVSSIVEEKKQENNLPVMLSKAQLAKYIFNVSPQTLDTHIITRVDFPKFKVGERILFPRDMVLEWVRKNMENKNGMNRRDVDE
ncbi:MAG: helix-turn-helix domain-containing protein [Bacillota bacterium]